MQFDLAFSGAHSEEFDVSVGETQKIGEVRNGHSPYLSEDTGTWWQWDDDAQQYVDTGVSASAGSGTIGTLTATYPDGSQDTYTGTETEWKINAGKVGAMEEGEVAELTNLQIEAIFKAAGL